MNRIRHYILNVGPGWAAVQLLVFAWITYLLFTGGVAAASDRGVLVALFAGGLLVGALSSIPVLAVAHHGARILNLLIVVLILGILFRPSLPPWGGAALIALLGVHFGLSFFFTSSESVITGRAVRTMTRQAALRHRVERVRSGEEA
ncbi:MAG: hypothetical protein IBJ11_04145 [Phycisphaerales bacterium]|nr:hypothetical protein [Phycisphaerales bacterium]